MLEATAHKNQYFFVAIDRSGSDPNTSYYGSALIASPYAEIFKDDIVTLPEVLPLSRSSRPEYKIL